MTGRDIAVRLALVVLGLIVFAALTIIPALFIGGRYEREQHQPAPVSPVVEPVSLPAGPPIVAGPDPLFTESDFDRAYAWLATQRREGSR